MEILCRCSSCSATFKVNERYAGKKAKCPKCAVVNIVPEASDAQSASDSKLLDSLAPKVPAPASEKRFREAPFTNANITAPDLGDAIGPPPEVKGAHKSEPPRVLPGKTPPLAASQKNSAKKPSAADTIKIEVNTSTPKSLVSSVVAKPKKKNGPPRLAWIIGGGSVAAVMVIGLIVFFAVGMSGKNKAVSFRNKPALVLDWPENERSGASILIDNKRQTFTKTGPIEFQLEPGAHEIVMQRRGYEQINHSFSLKMGERFPYKIEWKKNELAKVDPPKPDVEPTKPNNTQELVNSLPTVGPQGFDGWGQNFEVAKRKAKEKQHSILLLFACSDADRDTIQMAREILSTPKFQDYAKTRFQLIVLDFPRMSAGYNLVENSVQNKSLQKRFGIPSVPSVVLTDAEGNPYAIQTFSSEEVSRFVRAGADDFTQHLQLMQTRLAERDRLLAQTLKAMTPVEKLDAATAVIQWMRTDPDSFDSSLARFYEPLLREWLGIARKHDADNAMGKHEIFFEEDWKARLVNLATEKPDRNRLVEIMNDLLRWGNDHKYQDPNRAVRLHLAAAMVMLKLDEEDQAVEHITLASTYSPTDDSLKAQLAQISKVAKNPGQLSSGTGFVIDSTGYILTNHHVIEGPGRVVVRHPESEEQIPAEVVAKDAERDIALLRIDTNKLGSLTALKVSSVNLDRGAKVATFGYPLGDDLGGGIKLTTGIVSGLPNSSTDGMIVLDARVNPGNSGGPLVNTMGQVVGMITAKSSSGFGVDSYGMALPTKDLNKFLEAHLPNFTLDTETTVAAPLEWDAVDRIVSPSVLMILKVKQRK